MMEAGVYMQRQRLVAGAIKQHILSDAWSFVMPWSIALKVHRQVHIPSVCSVGCSRSCRTLFLCTCIRMLHVGPVSIDVCASCK